MVTKYTLLRSAILNHNLVISTDKQRILDSEDIIEVCDILAGNLPLSNENRHEYLCELDNNKRINMIIDHISRFTKRSVSAPGSF